MANIIGLLGVCCFLYAYFLLQTSRVSHTGALYLYLNFGGAVMVMISLLFEWNLPAFLLEAAWAMISMYGIYQHVYLPRQHTK